MFPETGSRPPQGMVTPQGPQTLFFIFTHVPMVIFLAIAVRNIVVKGSPTLLAFLAGGAICILFEPIVDVLGFCYFPPEGQWVGFTAYERQIPSFMWAVYSWFVGGQAYIFYMKFREQRVTKSGLWQLYGVLIIVNFCLELPGLLMGVYTYYGNQPFEFLGFPFWWPVLNPIMPITAGFIASRVVPHAGALGDVLIVPIPAMADGAVNGALAWPVWIALGREEPYSVTYSAALLTFGLALLTIWGMTTQLSEGEPVPAEAKSR